ncbi:MAG: hypothetical protein KatS3mg103_1133 [Phycisphaerales bacterium]|nr:MAG: hypothetical protein KatS3mg103_1133 [Phycisphaerales bacterium]
MNVLKTTLAASALAAVVVAAPPQIPATPAAVQDIVFAQPFVLDQGEVSTWRAERPMVTSGYILVLKVNPDLVYPRQSAEPVLYVGDTTAERLNVGYRSGYVVAVVGAPIEGQDALDLAKAKIWFGTPELPERVDAARIAQESALADAAGIKPFPADKIKALLEQNQTLREPNKAAILDEVAALIRRFSPQEEELAVAYEASSGQASGS